MRYTLKSGIANAAAGLTNYQLNMKYQDVGLTIGLQTQFLFRTGEVRASRACTAATLCWATASPRRVALRWITLD